MKIDLKYASKNMLNLLLSFYYESYARYNL